MLAKATGIGGSMSVSRTVPSDSTPIPCLWASASDILALEPQGPRARRSRQCIAGSRSHARRFYLMNTRFLETFLWAARLNSFSAAAERLHTTQASVSNRIAALERELGVVLFTRDVRCVNLTPAGRLALQHAEKIVNHAGVDGARSGGAVRYRCRRHAKRYRDIHARWVG